MTKMKKFLILDIDGVLLEMRGYRLACVDTINDFLAQMGQPSLRVTVEIHDALESSGINSEWDMVPLTLAAFVNWYCEMTGQIPDGGEFPPRCDAVRIDDNEGFLRMLLDRIKTWASLLNSSETPINAVYHADKSGKAQKLESLWRLPFRDRFFVDTLDPWKCPFFARLMNLLLGKETFESFYGMGSVADCDSYLETKDRLLISDEYRLILPDLPEKGIYPAVMTSRPSLLPADAGNKSSSYFVNTPEGECALRMLGWDNGRMPMIGCGSICYIEEKLGLRLEYYVKPHPYHALAAMIFSLCGNEIRALEKSVYLCEQTADAEQDPLGEWIGKDEHLVLSVYEDSVSGIESTRKAAGLLRQWGYQAEAVPFGIGSTPSKNELLRKAGVMIYNDINSALDCFFEKH